jgi:hypothetical protein
MYLHKINNIFYLSTVDFIRLMAFDWPPNNLTSLINPLYSVGNQQDDDQFNNIVNLYLSF